MKRAPLWSTYPIYFAASCKIMSARAKIYQFRRYYFMDYNVTSERTNQVLSPSAQKGLNYAEPRQHHHIGEKSFRHTIHKLNGNCGVQWAKTNCPTLLLSACIIDRSRLTRNNASLNFPHLFCCNFLYYFGLEFPFPISF